MARRKSLLAQMYAERQKAKQAAKQMEERAARAWAAEERKIAAQADRQEAQRRREEERATQAKAREEQGKLRLPQRDHFPAPPTTWSRCAR